MKQSGQWYIEVALKLLEPLADRWLHVQAVGQCAERVAQVVTDGDVLVAAAWLHDIGYAPEIAETGFHPIDGARYLQAQCVDKKVVALVAHHSCAHVEAERRGIAELLAEFDRPAGAVADALTYCDMRRGPRGQVLTFEQRLADILERYPSGSVVHESIVQAKDELRGMVVRTEALLAAAQL